jgi:hypothetical protein
MEATKDGSKAAVCFHPGYPVANVSNTYSSALDCGVKD